MVFRVLTCVRRRAVGLRRRVVELLSSESWLDLAQRPLNIGRPLLR